MPRGKKVNKYDLFNKYLELNANAIETAKFFGITRDAVYKSIFLIERNYKLENLRTQSFEILCDLVHNPNPSIKLKAIELISKITSDIKKETTDGKFDSNNITEIVIE